MTCSRYRLIIDDVGDLDRLPPDVSRHVDACAPCATFGRELVALRALLKEPGRVQAPVDFDARLARRLAAKPAPVVRGPWGWTAAHHRPLAAAAAFVVLLSAAATTGILRYDAPDPIVAPKTAAAPPVEAVAPALPKDAETTADVEPARAPSAHVAAPVPAVVQQVAMRTSAPRPAAPARPRPRAVASDGAQFYVSDDAGAHVVTVPAVLVGAREIMPASLDSQSSGDGPASMAF